MMEEQRQYFRILFFIYLLFCSSQFAISQCIVNFISGVPTLWINKLTYTPILLERNTGLQFLYGFSCNFYPTECSLGISLVAYNSTAGETIYIERGHLVWSANRDRPVKANATLQLGQDGNLVLADSDGTLVWSSNTTGKSVSGLNLTETGNLVLFDTTNRTVWQSFDHPTDCLLPGKNLVSVTKSKLQQSVSADNSSQGLFSLTVLNGSWATYIDSDPPQYYYTSDNPDSPYWSFDGHSLTALQYPPTSIAQYIQLGHDGHLRIYQLDNLENNMLGLNWKEFSHELNSSVFWIEGKKIEDCQRACLSNCSCKAAVYDPYLNMSLGGNCLLLNEVFSLMDYGVGTAFLKVQNSPNAPVIFPRQKSPFKVIIGCTLIRIILILSVCSALSKKRSEKCKAGDFLDLEPILPGILTRFSYNELKIITDDFSRKLGKGGFGSVYEGTLSNGTKIAVKHLDGVGQVKESFLTEVKTVGGIHHINLVKLIGFCAEKATGF
ncbi:hypothetical protein KY285_032110 [Solanum tuberosum]|nr:hypothetical protein KY284_031125 [Solanum tuberosum]KAH0657228.1 hypothetical protein KY285_032110 [Solanum tuberosum]